MGNAFLSDGTDELQCARELVRCLFDRTGLSSLLRDSPAVIVGKGNWISFASNEPVSREDLLALSAPDGRNTFVLDVFSRPRTLRSRTNPSLHLTSFGPSANLAGHVDAYFWPWNPFRHAREFLFRTTTPPSELLARFRVTSEFRT